MPLRSARFQSGCRTWLRMIAQRVLLEDAPAVELEGRDDHALLEDRLGVGRHRARGLAADVGHVAEHRRPADDPAAVEDRQHDQPVVGVADRRVAGVRVRGEQDVALLDGVVEAGRAASGTDRPNWPTTILPSRSPISGNSSCCSRMPGRQRGAEQHLVHLVAGVAQGVLDEVERDEVDVDPASGSVVALDDLCHGSALRAERMKQAAAGVDRRGVAGQDEGGGVHLGDDRGTGDDVAGQQQGAVVERRVDGLAVDPDRRRAGPGRGRRRRRPRPASGSATSGAGPLTVARTLTSSCSLSSRKENSRSCSASKAARSASRPAPLPSKAARSTSTGISKPWPW